MSSVPPDREALVEKVADALGTWTWVHGDIFRHHRIDGGCVSLDANTRYGLAEAAFAALERAGFCVVPTGDAERQPSTSEMAYSVQWMADPYQAAKEARHGRG